MFQTNGNYVIDKNGNEIYFPAAVSLMDDDLREFLQFRLSPCSNQTFFDAYCVAHYEKFGEEFEVN